jgi:hypothetical protein
MPGYIDFPSKFLGILDSPATPTFQATHSCDSESVLNKQQTNVYISKKKVHL